MSNCFVIIKYRPNTFGKNILSILYISFCIMSHISVCSSTIIQSISHSLYVSLAATLRWVLEKQGQSLVFLPEITTGQGPIEVPLNWLTWSISQCPKACLRKLSKLQISLKKISGVILGHRPQSLKRPGEWETYQFLSPEGLEGQCGYSSWPLLWKCLDCGMQPAQGHEGYSWFPESRGYQIQHQR